MYHPTTGVASTLDTKVTSIWDSDAPLMNVGDSLLQTTSPSDEVVSAKRLPLEFSTGLPHSQAFALKSPATKNGTVEARTLVYSLLRKSLYSNIVEFGDQ